MTHAAVRWEQQGPKSWTARDHDRPVGLVLRVADRFLAFDEANRPLGSEATLQEAQSAVTAAVGPSARRPRDVPTLMISVLAVVTIAGAAIVIALRTLS